MFIQWRVAAARGPVPSQTISDSLSPAIDAVLPREVVRRRDDAALLRRAADDHRMADQFRPLRLLDGGVEGANSAVQDHRRRLSFIEGAFVFQWEGSGELRAEAFSVGTLAIVGQ